MGSFNLNGRGNGTKEDLSAWLCPKLNHLQRPAEIVAVGFQEIVELSPQQIMSTDPARRQDWEMAVKRTLNEDARKHHLEEYVLLRSGQLVGAALMIFVKSHVLKLIKNVEGSVKKVCHASPQAAFESKTNEKHSLMAVRLECLGWRVIKARLQFVWTTPILLSVS